MFSRYRSYTTYSEENGKLVPSVEPQLIEVRPTDNTQTLCTSTNTADEPEKKLKPADNK